MGSKGREPPGRLAEAVRYERNKRGWTSAELATRSGLSGSWIRNFEIGIIRQPPIEKIHLLEKAFHMRLGELYATSIGMAYEDLLALARSGSDQSVPWDVMIEKLSAISEQQAEMIDRQVEMLDLLRVMADSISAGEKTQRSLDRTVRRAILETDGHGSHRQAKGEGV